MTHRCETVSVFDNNVVAESPAKIKDGPVGELIKSLMISASDCLKHLSLSHIRINSNQNAELMCKLLSTQADHLETIYFEQMFGKKNCFQLAFAGLGGLAC